TRRKEVAIGPTGETWYNAQTVALWERSSTRSNNEEDQHAHEGTNRWLSGTGLPAGGEAAERAGGPRAASRMPRAGREALCSCEPGCDLGQCQEAGRAGPTQHRPALSQCAVLLGGLQPAHHR